MAIEATPTKRQDSSILEHPCRSPIDATFEERQLRYNKSNDSAAQHAKAGGSGDDRNKSEPRPSPDVIESDWVVLSQSAPSITDSGNSSSDVNGPQASPLNDSPELTVDVLRVHNMKLESMMSERGLFERLWDQDGRGSIVAQNGTVAQASNDSVDLLGGPWAPAEHLTESVFFGVGSWVDMPRPPVFE